MWTLYKFILTVLLVGCAVLFAVKPSWSSLLIVLVVIVVVVIENQHDL